MNAPAAPIAVVLPCRDARHLLWRSLASVAAQTVPPAQVLVLDQASSDGLGDWLRVRWPGVELLPVPAGCGAAEIGAAVAPAVTAPRAAVLRPGERWPSDHLAALLAESRGRADGTGGLLPAAGLGEAAMAALAASEETAAPCPRSLDAAIAALPASGEVILLDLRAASRPAGLLDLLGLAAALGPTGRPLRAATLADPLWPLLDAVPRPAPLLVSLSPLLGLARASEQLCIEELLRRAGDRPVRLALGGLAPSPPPLMSRLLDAASAHPDLELWLADRVSVRLGASLLGRDRVRLVPPPVLALAPILQDLTARSLVQPRLLAKGGPGADLDARAVDHDAWWAGFDPEGMRRLGPALARVLGAWRWLRRGTVLQQAWLSALVGWAAARSHAGGLRTGELGVAVFAAACGRPVELVAGDAKQRDAAASWRATLAELGVRVV